MKTTNTRNDAELKLETPTVKKDRLVDLDAVLAENMKLFAYIRGRLEQQATEHAMIFPEAVRSKAVREWTEANRLLCHELSMYRPGYLFPRKECND